MRRFVFILFTALATMGAYAQAKFTVNAPSTVIEGQQFQVKYVLSNGEGNSFNIPPIDGCQLLYDQGVSTSYSQQIIGNKVETSYSYTYTHIYRATKAGDYTIPAASVMVDGKKITTSSKGIKVLPPDKNAPQSSQPDPYGNPQPRASQPQQKISDNDIFVRVLLNKTKVYEQEAVECTIKLYTRYESIVSIAQKTPPKYDGFLIEELDVQPQLNEIEHYNGYNYRTAILKRAILFPQQSGKLTVSTGSYTLVVQQVVRRSMGMFGYIPDVTESEVPLREFNQSVNVSPLPQPQPEGFNGAVGKFTFSSKLSSESLRTGEAASLTLKVDGTGNIKYLKEPVVEFPSEFELYSPKQTYDTHVTGTTVSGNMTAEYTFVPASVGRFNIAAPHFVYFDPSEGRYVTLEGDAYTINVAKGAGVSVSSNEQQGIKIKNNDILHIRLGDKNLGERGRYLAQEWWYWALFALLLALFGATVMIIERRNRAFADVAGRRKAQAGKVARRRLALAAKELKAGQRDRFYDALLKAMWGYLSDKLGMAASELTRGNIRDELIRHGATEEQCNEAIWVLDECEMARYTPESQLAPMSDVLDKAENVMNSLQSLKLKVEN